MRTVLSDFRKSLARVRDIADDVDRNIATIMSDASVRNRYETIQCSAPVILSGFFESFLKQMAEKCIAEVCGLGRPFSTLPARIRQSHYELGGAVLAQRMKDDRGRRPSRILATVDNIAARLASVTANPYDIVWEAFGDTRANPNTETVVHYLKRFGINRPWTKVAAKTGLSAGVLQTSLDSFLLLRHECAHTGTASTVPTPSEIRAYADLLEKIAVALVDVLEEHVAAL